MICCAFSFEIEASVLHRTLKHLFGIGGLILECLRPPYPAPKHWPTQHWPSFHSLSTHQSCARTRGSEAHFHRRHPKHRKQLWSSRSAQTYQYQSATSNISDVALIGASRNINIYIYIHIYIYHISCLVMELPAVRCQANAWAAACYFWSSQADSASVLKGTVGGKSMTCNLADEDSEHPQRNHFWLASGKRFLELSVGLSACYCAERDNYLTLGKKHCQSKRSGYRRTTVLTKQHNSPHFTESLVTGIRKEETPGSAATGHLLLPLWGPNNSSLAESMRLVWQAPALHAWVRLAVWVWFGTFRYGKYRKYGKYGYVWIP